MLQSGGTRGDHRCMSQPGSSGWLLAPYACSWWGSRAIESIKGLVAKVCQARGRTGRDSLSSAQSGTAGARLVTHRTSRERDTGSGRLGRALFGEDRSLQSC